MKTYKNTTSNSSNDRIQVGDLAFQLPELLHILSQKVSEESREAIATDGMYTGISIENLTMPLLDYIRWSSNIVQLASIVEQIGLAMTSTTDINTLSFNSKFWLGEILDKSGKKIQKLGTPDFVREDQHTKIRTVEIIDESNEEHY